jgi:hypothetical protein
MRASDNTIKVAAAETRNGETETTRNTKPAIAKGTVKHANTAKVISHETKFGCFKNSLA